MRSIFSFEMSKTRKSNWIILTVTWLVQLVSIYFFTIVGRFDTSSTDEILNNYSGLTGLASTITMCVAIIYGTIVVNRLIVTNYIGDSRLRLYLYPKGKGTLYIIKNVVFIASFSARQLLGIILANAIYVVSESFFPILKSSSLVSSSLLDFLSSSMVCVLLTVSIILISSFIGIYISSLVATIVSGITLIALSGNIMAMSFANYQVITLIISFFIAAIVFLVGVNITARRIDKDEVF